MRRLILLVLLLALGGAAVAGGLRLFSVYGRQPGPLPAEKLVFIAPGTGVRAMAAQLAREGVIDRDLAFLAAVRLSGQGRALKAGEYLLPAHIALFDLVGTIARGDVFARKVTIPEGLTGHEIMDILNNAEAMRGHIDTPPAEGSILPDTYAYIRDEDRTALLAKMRAAMTGALDSLWAGRAPGLPFTTQAEALVLASVVEKETGIAAERARIAGVFVNRLRAGMRLQSDPTVIYAVTGGASKLPRVLYEHLETDSPYNTYKYAGLPPGPICNPGRAALEAVLHPENNDFLYFVADGTGGHVFARSIADHNANVAKWRAAQRKTGK